MKDSPSGSTPDAPPASPDAGTPDAARPDAPPDAPPPNVTFTTAKAFPTPNSTLVDFTDAELAGLGVTGTGFTRGFGGLIGNADAPMGNNFAGLSSAAAVATFSFSTPIHAFGLSTTDIDFGNDNSVIVTVAGLDASSSVVATFQRALTPNDTNAAENANALFVGWKTAANVVTVRVTIDQSNSTLLDNMVFQH
ncbi:MAG TPA: hypothetical protein VFP84_12945 [Kofleriaceae bacterium]|nr:hypothetical protein [Kofleriaceae bacterium]